MYGLACDDIGIWPMNFYNVFVGLAQVKHVWSILEHLNFIGVGSIRPVSLATRENQTAAPGALLGTGSEAGRVAETCAAQVLEHHQHHQHQDTLSCAIFGHETFR